MKITEPKKVRTLMAGHRWASAEAMARDEKVSLHAHTIRKALRGENIDGETAFALADALGVDVLEIAEYAEN